MDGFELAKQAYHAYGEFTGFKNYQGLPLPAWEDLTPTIRSAWHAAVAEVMRVAYVVDAPNEFNERELAAIKHAQAYADNHTDAGAPGHSQFLLIAKLARRLWL